LGPLSDQALARHIAIRLGLPDDVEKVASNFIHEQLAAQPKSARGAIVIHLAELLASLEDSEAYGEAAQRFNQRVQDALDHARTPDSTDRESPSGLPGLTLRLTDQAEHVTGGSGSDHILAPLNGLVPTLQAGDAVDGGGGVDQLQAVLTPPGDGVIRLQTQAIETVSIQPQDPLGIGQTVRVDAGDMDGVLRLQAVGGNSRLVIEHLDPPGATSDLRIELIGTGADLGVYLDRLSFHDQATTELAIELLYLGGTADDPPLLGIAAQGIRFLANGRLIELADPPRPAPYDPDGFEAAQTYPQLLAAVQRLLHDPDNLARWPELAHVTAFLGEAFEMNAWTGNGVRTGTQLVLSAPADLIPTMDAGTFVTRPEGIPSMDWWQWQFATSPQGSLRSVSGAEDAHLITATLMLDQVGRGETGGDLVIGASSDLAEVAGGRRAGVGRFDITVERDSALGVIASTHGHRQEVVLHSGAAQGRLSVLGHDQRATVFGAQADAADGDWLDGVDAAVAAFGFSNVNTIDGSALLAPLVFDAVITSDAPTVFDAKGNWRPYTYGGGQGNDEMTVLVERAVVDRVDADPNLDRSFRLEVNGGAGDDSLTVRIGAPGATAQDVAQSPERFSAQTWPTLVVNAGYGIDRVFLPGGGGFQVDLGAGDDVVFTDNTGAPPGMAGEAALNHGRAVWVLNSADQSQAEALVSARNLPWLRADAQADAEQPIAGAVTVSFKGLSAQASVPDNDGIALDARIIQAIRTAIEQDAVLNELLELADGPGQVFLIGSRVDGQMAEQALTIELHADDASGLAALAPLLTREAYTPRLANGRGTLLTGADSHASGDHRVAGGLGNDLIVLGTAASDHADGSSNDTVVYGPVYDAGWTSAFGHDVILNFTSRTAGRDIDRFDFRDLGGTALMGYQWRGSEPEAQSLALLSGGITAAPSGADTDTAEEVAALF
jgi:hypothetical protein